MSVFIFRIFSEIVLTVSFFIAIITTAVILSSRKVQEILYSHWFFGNFYLAEEELKARDNNDDTYDVFIIFDYESHHDKELVRGRP
jgi:hypothetical protein